MADLRRLARAARPRARLIGRRLETGDCGLDLRPEGGARADLSDDDTALGADQKSRGEARRAVFLHHLVAREQHREVELEPLRRGGAFSGRFTGVDTQNDELAGILVVKCAQLRHLLDAVPSPARPEIDQDIPPAPVLGEADRFPLRVPERKVRRGRADRQLRCRCTRREQHGGCSQPRTQASHHRCLLASIPGDQRLREDSRRGSSPSGYLVIPDSSDVRCVPDVTGPRRECRQGPLAAAPLQI